MQLFIPPLGTKLVLIEPWTFKMYDEYRNVTFIENLIEAGFHLNKVKKDHSNYWKVLNLGDVTLPAGMQLTLKRLYIRNGQKDFDSVTFMVTGTMLNGKKIKGRFWVKLEDANKMKVEIV